MNFTHFQRVQLLQNHATADQWRRLFVARKQPARWVYEAYLGSTAWRLKRLERLEIDGHRCVACMQAGFLEIHHAHYRNVGSEDVENDLVTLCKSCHKRTHNNEPLLARVLFGPSVIRRATETGGLVECNWKSYV